MLTSIGQVIIQTLKNKEKDKFDLLVKQLFPIDIALALEYSTEEELKTFIQFTTPEYHAKVLEQANEKLQLRIIRHLDYAEVVQIFAKMSKDDVVDTIGSLPTNLRKELLHQMKVSEFVTIEELLSYSPKSAGGIMTTEFIAVKASLNTKDALNTIIKEGFNSEVIETIFVLNQKNELVGTADLRDILASDGTTLMHDITNENHLSVFPDADQEKVALLVSKYDLKAVAVVNQNNNLLGIITVDDIIDVIVEEQTEDILRLGGVSGQETTGGTLIHSIQRRIPWLIINLGTAFLAAFTVTLFESVIAQVVALASSMSIVTGMGGNAGNQTLSVVIRSIALGELELKKSWHRVFREIAIGVVQGAIVGLFAGIILYFKVGNPMIGFIIFLAMIGNMIVASTFGFLIPLILKHFKFDPALGSSIFLTASTDVLGFFFFLGLATLFLPWLV